MSTSLEEFLKARGQTPGPARSLNFDSIISLQPEIWEEEWQTPHHLVRAFADHVPVYFIPELPLEGFTRKSDVWDEVERNIHVFRDRWWMRSQKWSYRLQQLMLGWRAGAIASFLREQKLRAPLLYVWHPELVPTAMELGGVGLCYHIVDDWDLYPNVGPAEKKVEDKALAVADVVFAITQRILDRKQNRIQGSSHVIGNGVDFDRFRQTSINDPEGHPRLRELPRPRIGYVGRFNTKVDLDLLTRLAVLFPQWQFVLVGPTGFFSPTEQKQWAALIQLPNVHYFGACSPEMVPDYMCALDVGLMPYKQNPSLWSFEGYPLKLHEYLALGLPVVSCNMPAIQPFANVIAICSTLQEWGDCLKAVLSNGSTSTELLKDTRRRVAEANSWKRIAEKVIELLAGANTKPGTSRVKPWAH